MTEYKVVDKLESSIATMKPTVRQRRLTLVLAAVVLLATAIIAPFGAVQLRRIDGFIPATESIIIITDFFTAVLLFSQSRIIGSRGLLLLASGYLFSALVVLPHLLTFPGAFAPSGLLGAGLSTTAWLFIFWHLGLPVSVIAYAYLIDERRALTRSAIYWSVTLVIGLACLLTWIVAVHGDALPALFVDHYQFRQFALAGGVLSYGLSFTDIYRQVGRYAGAVLSGAKPSDLPVQQVTKFELVINMKPRGRLASKYPTICCPSPTR